MRSQLLAFLPSDIHPGCHLNMPAGRPKPCGRHLCPCGRGATTISSSRPAHLPSNSQPTHNVGDQPVVGVWVAQQQAQALEHGGQVEAGAPGALGRHIEDVLGMGKAQEKWRHRREHPLEITAPAVSLSLDFGLLSKPTTLWVAGKTGWCQPASRPAAAEPPPALPPALRPAQAAACTRSPLTRQMRPSGSMLGW